MKIWRWRTWGWLGIAAFLGACDLGDGPSTVFVNTPIAFSVVEGAEPEDTVQARVPIRVALLPEDDETPRPLRIQVLFRALGEDCGDPEVPLVVSDPNDEAEGVWILGRTAQQCVLEVRALAPSGTTLGVTNIEASVLPGQPVEGWLPPGTAARGVDALTVDSDAYPLEDRFGNLMGWRFAVTDGPAVTLGSDPEDPLSRTLAATGAGSGHVEVISPFGSFLAARFDVCVFEEKRWIRVFRPEDASAVLAVCP